MYSLVSRLVRARLAGAGVMRCVEEGLRTV